MEKMNDFNISAHTLGWIICDYNNNNSTSTKWFLEKIIITICFQKYVHIRQYILRMVSKQNGIIDNRMADK